MSRISSELRPVKKLKMEDQLLLENVEKKKEEARDPENQVAEGGIMERSSLGRSLCLKKEEPAILNKLVNFSDGPVADDTPCENTGNADLSEKTQRKKKMKKKKTTTRKKNEGKNTVIGQGGVGKTTITNTGSTTTMTFGNIRI